MFQGVEESSVRLAPDHRYQRADMHALIRDAKEGNTANGFEALLVDFGWAGAHRMDRLPVDDLVLHFATRDVSHLFDNDSTEAMPEKKQGL